MANRLSDALSPYLRQHADNPVDWWPWCDEALEEARRRDVPIFLSIGYAACHWCHVMAQESFDDEQVAAALADGFVAVKVDREERPDLDAVYMSATVALTGAGGWPMTVLLAPSGEPIWAGTYLPKDRLLALLAGASDVWRRRREDVLQSGRAIADALADAGRPAAPAPLGETELRSAFDALARDFDAEAGGFGGAPKFPPSMVLEWLLARHGRIGAPEGYLMAERTCVAMARGGMYDQLAGGFARYSVDAGWVVPHFEKMLYDNALLLGVYARAHRAASTPAADGTSFDGMSPESALPEGALPEGVSPEGASLRDAPFADLAGRIARETACFLLRELRTPQGAFASALDADSAGVEGLTYAWTPGQLAEVLGSADGVRAAQLLGVTEAGTFEHGSSTLQLRTDPEDPGWWNETRAKLLRARADRPQPARDDKVVTAWNGLAIGALADAGVILGEPEFVEAAQEAAAHLLATHWVDGRLRRTSLEGQVSDAAGVAVDYGNLAAGLVRLAQATSDARWVSAAGDILQVAIDHFALPDGGFADTADDGEALFTRPREAGDNAEPCGQSSLAGALLAYGALTGSPAHLERGAAALGAMGSLAARVPRFAGHALTVAEWSLAGPLQVAVVTLDESDPRALALLAAARHGDSPGAVVAFGRPDTAGWPLLEDRPLVADAPAAYVCRGFVCDAPVSHPTELSRLLAARGVS